MPTLTGPQTGTTGNDTFLGEFSVFSEIPEGPSFPFGFGFKDATVTARDGDDGITGIAEVGVGASGGSASATGVADSTVLGGNGADTVVATGIGEARNATGQASGFGTSRSRIFTNDDDDVITISGVSKALVNTFGAGATGSFIDGGRDNDTITIQYSVLDSVIENSGAEPAVATGAGVSTSTIRGRQGSDTIDISANVTLERFSPVVGPVDSEATVRGAFEAPSISGNGGDDVLKVSAIAEAGQVTSTALDKSRLLGDDGNDQIEIIATGLGLSASTTAALTNSSGIWASSGDDVITISVNAASGGPVSGTTDAFGLLNSRLDGGDGRDVVTLSVLGSSVDSGSAVGAENSKINLGDGDDTISVEVSGSGNASGVAAGFLGTNLRGGGGNDSITIQSSASGEDSITGDATGAKNAKIEGDAGDDTIKIRASFGFGNLDVEDVV
ncbi:MAG: hypothetical protein AAFO83_15320, partial [Cyanobacteria bacterium J06607_13]